MIIIPGNLTVFCDVDSTLVEWESTPEDKASKGVNFTCPGSTVYDENGSRRNLDGGWSELLVPNWAQIEELKKHKIRGHLVVVWSAGGYDWAKEVVETLNLQEYVDVVMCKPTWVYDDLPSSEFMPKSRLVMEKK